MSHNPTVWFLPETGSFIPCQQGVHIVVFPSDKQLSYELARIKTAEKQKNYRRHIYYLQEEGRANHPDNQGLYLVLFHLHKTYAISICIRSLCPSSLAFQAEDLFQKKEGQTEKNLKLYKIKHKCLYIWWSINQIMLLREHRRPNSVLLVDWLCTKERAREIMELL